MIIHSGKRFDGHLVALCGTKIDRRVGDGWMPGKGDGAFPVNCPVCLAILGDNSGMQSVVQKLLDRTECFEEAIMRDEVEDLLQKTEHYVPTMP